MGYKKLNETDLPKIGQRFGMLTIVEFVRKEKSIRYYKCLCDCGKEKIVNMYSLRSGRTASCGCLQEKTRKENAKRVQPLATIALKKKGDSLENSKNLLINRLYTHYIFSAESRKIEFDLTLEDFTSLILSDCCFHCGSDTKNIFIRGRRSLEYLGVDRLDSSKGYRKDNCVPCCKICNYAKSYTPLNEFYSWARRLVKYQESKNGNQDPKR